MRKNSNKAHPLLRRVSLGVALSIFLLFIISLTNDIIFGEIFLYETIPGFNYDANWRISQMFNWEGRAAGNSDEKGAAETTKAQPTFIEPDPLPITSPPIDIIGLSDIIFETGTVYEDVQSVIETQITRPFDVSEFTSLDVLRTRMYTVNPCTRMTYADFDVERFIATDLRIDQQAALAGKPVVLIFHTHSTEMFVDSDPADKFTGIVGVGAYLAQLLNDMGIPTIHMTNRWDVVNGQSMIRGAYERQEADIRAMLERYPSIEVIIDMHRDGLPDGAPKLLTTIDGQPAAQIMFFNGLSQLNVNGVNVPIASLPNPNLPYNLAFSFQMQMAANDMFPGFTRRIFLRAYRFSLHFLPKSLLIEVGAQNNTFQEAINAMRPLADVLAAVVN